MTTLDSTLHTRLSRFLTSDILDQLPQSHALTQAVQRLNTLHKAVASFLPQYIVEDEARLMQDYGNLSPGTLMFADVSGFTALSERLRERAGPEGIEILTQVINDYFSTMLEILAKSDGQLLKFAGDALLTFFPARSGQDEFPKAINTGLRMQRAMQEKFQPIQNRLLGDLFGEHDLELTMSIGISRGHLLEVLVGNISQRDHMIMGWLPGEADEAEKAGIRDDVIIPANLSNDYSHLFETRPTKNPHFVQILDNFGDKLGDYEFSMPARRRPAASVLFSFDDASLMADLQHQINRLEVISRFVSSEIVNKLVVKGDHIESENRLATVIFVHVTGFAELLQAWGEDRVSMISVLLSQYYSLMQRVIATHGGVLTRTDPYSLGSKMLITFGAPVAHPDDPDRAVLTCLDMNRQLAQFNNRLRDELPHLADLFPFIKQRMGVTQGNVYAGEVGWRQRREYTVMGDDVNLAARLMSKATFGQIIISQTVWERVQARFETEPLPPFAAKGKALPIFSYAVTGLAQIQANTISDTPFIGRDVILLSLNMALQQAERGSKNVKAMALTGDMGVGKTRLAKHFSISAQNMGFQVIWATCRNQTNRKATWASLMTQLLNLEHGVSQGQQHEALHNQLDALGLSELEDVFRDLMLESGESTRRAAANRAQRRRTLKASTNIFDKLSSEQTLAMKKNDLAQFRAQMKKNLGPSSPSSLPSWSELDMKVSLTDALIRFLETYTQKQPLLIVIDDLHKDHPRALNVFKRLVSDLRNARLMILVTYEDHDDLSFPDVHRLAVGDLPEDQTYLMASGMMNGVDLGIKLCDCIWSNTSGRALYIESLMQTLFEHEQIEVVQGMAELRPEADVNALPDNVRGLIISRIDRLSADVRTLLRAAAVLEDQFVPSGLAYVSELDHQLVNTLSQELVNLQLWEEYENRRFRFKHGVTQQALYEELTRSQRLKLHSRAADYFSRLEAQEQHTLFAVYHLLKGNLPQQAVELLTHAGEQAEENQDVEQAIEFYTKALDIIPDDEVVQDRLARLQ